MLIAELLSVVLANEALLKVIPKFRLIIVLINIVESLLPSLTREDISLSLYTFRVLSIILYVPILTRSGS